MSVSLYYTAKRKQPITLQEQSSCDKIAQRYDKQYPYGELYEGFCLYDLEKFKGGIEKDVILDGATKLPMDIDEKLFLDIVNWWLKCLGEMVDVLTGAQWDVHLDDMEFQWSEQKHSFYYL